MLALFTQPAILLCLVYFALIAANTVGIQQFAVPAWVSMFGISENYAALCLIVFIVGSAGGVLVGGFFADRVRRHDRVATIGLLVAGALTLPIAMQAVTPALLLPLLALAGCGRRRHRPVARHDRARRHAARRLGQGVRLRLFRPRCRLVPGAAGVRQPDGPRPCRAIIFWIAVGLYVINAGLVMAIRQSTTPTVATRPAAAE